MKLPRWLVIAMLTTSVLSPLAAAGWWWVARPEQDMRDFLSLVENDRFEEANEIMVNSNSWVRLPDGHILFQVGGGDRFSCGSARWRDKFQNAERQPRTWTDLCAGRMRLRLLPSPPMNRSGPTCVELIFEKHRVSSKTVDISERDLDEMFAREESETP